MANKIFPALDLPEDALLKIRERQDSKVIYDQLSKERNDILQIMIPKLKERVQELNKLLNEYNEQEKAGDDELIQACYDSICDQIKDIEVPD